MLQRSAVFYGECLIEKSNLICHLFLYSWCLQVEQGMATHSSILAWRMPWTEEPGGLQSIGRKESDTTERLHFHFIKDLVEKWHIIYAFENHLTFVISNTSCWLFSPLESTLSFLNFAIIYNLFASLLFFLISLFKSERILLFPLEYSP